MTLLKKTIVLKQEFNIPPLAPVTLLTASVVNGTTIEISFSDPGPEATNYSIEWDTSSSFSAPSSDLISSNPGGSTIRNIIVANTAVKYYIRVKTIEHSRESAWRTTSSF